MTERQVLLIDADDTLWENNIYFEQAIASFLSYVDHREHTQGEVRTVLMGCERESIREHGYGLRSFRHSLLACFTHVRGAAPTAEEEARILAFGKHIEDAEIELLAGVAEALPQLAERHCLVLVTKGDPEEQRGKLARSGIHAHFSAVEVPEEKHEGTYRRLVEKYGLHPEKTWMIGNSPRSDINPALAAGLHAILIRHPNTWELEHDQITTPAPPQQLLQIDSFQELLAHF